MRKLFLVYGLYKKVMDKEEIAKIKNEQNNDKFNQTKQCQ